MRLHYAAIPIIFMIHAAAGKAQRNQIYSNRIASLQVTVGNNWLAPPIAKLNELNNTPVNISFDDMTHEYHRYTYTIEHCEADWETSESLFASDYIEGFSEGNTIDNVAQSVNTNQLYTHYSLSIPNERCAIKMSGNYRLTVYDDNNNQEPILSACFYVVEPAARVTLAVTTNTDIDINKAHQQVSMQLRSAECNRSAKTDTNCGNAKLPMG